MTIIIYIAISLFNVFLHIVRSILVIKSGKLLASVANCICYTFSAVVVKFIAETDLWIAIAVQATTNFVGCYLAMWFCEWWLGRKKKYKRYVSDESLDALKVREYMSVPEICDIIRKINFE